ncbi:hypothetical protein FTO68_11175 [Methanocalculus taiwanensis]|uniref:glutamine--fructose-6-phosphate transaminase (isomerizing) n=2 Tax=Methanocalculus taiwanensis TaxID=106207 RepID=A0ABD4TP51_9EURY|nr:hypothetical protein [Methanocalculus taiwanensis]
MCGIFGIVTPNLNNCSEKRVKYIADKLFVFSESRGKESAGLAIRTSKNLQVYKKPEPASHMILTKEYIQFVNNALKNEVSDKQYLAIIGHSRLVTNGIKDSNSNNQPVMNGCVVGVHNGIIVNNDKLWEQCPEIHRSTDVDTEVFLALLQHNYNLTKSLASSCIKTFSAIEGSASVAVLFSNMDNLLLATNTGSLYITQDLSKNLFIFASEQYILNQLVQDVRINNGLNFEKISQIGPNHACIVDINNLSNLAFSLNPEQYKFELKENCAETSVEVLDLSPKTYNQDMKARRNSHTLSLENRVKLECMIEDQIKNLPELKRCTCCILPETFPFIEFDEKGVCNYCKNYSKVDYKGKDALEMIISEFRSDNGDPDCLVGFSGGRDSSYMLHYVKKVLKLNPIAFSYDWGMVTDLARRNQARLCGKLGIENIIISADIEEKRKYIRDNIRAWLKRPDLGMIPLLMAGDKQMFNYYPYKLMQQTGINLFFNGSNQLEKTGFKLGFCGIEESINHNKGQLYTGISLTNKLQLALFYGKNYLLNPSYINSSIIDTLHAYYTSYFIPDVSTYFYNYISWDENEIVSILRKEYDWEIATDTTTTWRIGDGTASFYNYIYYIVAGFSENDTFRSNQIREGIITREKALKLAEEENKPRIESLEWYAETIGFDLEDALTIIHSIPKMWDNIW